MSLSTIYLYKKSFPTTLDTDDNITQALNISTKILEKYCDRNFESQTYFEEYDGYDEASIIRVKQYPITKINDFVVSFDDLITVNLDSTKADLRISANTTALNIITTEFDGTETTNILNYNTYTTIQSITAAIDSLSNVSATILSSEYNNVPSRYIRNIDVNIPCNSTGYISCWFKDRNVYGYSYSIDPDTQKWFRFSDGYNSKLVRAYKLKYVAGYVYPVDNNTHTALSINGTVPDDLIEICNRLASVILKDMANGITSGQYNRENLGDYGYAIWSYEGKQMSSISGFLNTYSDIIEPYKRVLLVL